MQLQYEELDLCRLIVKIDLDLAISWLFPFINFQFRTETFLSISLGWLEWPARFWEVQAVENVVKPPIQQCWASENKHPRKPLQNHRYADLCAKLPKEMVSGMHIKDKKNGKQVNFSFSKIWWASKVSLLAIENDCVARSYRFSVPLTCTRAIIRQKVYCTILHRRISSHHLHHGHTIVMGEPLGAFASGVAGNATMSTGLFLELWRRCLLPWASLSACQFVFWTHRGHACQNTLDARPSCSCRSWDWARLESWKLARPSCLSGIRITPPTPFLISAFFFFANQISQKESTVIDAEKKKAVFNLSESSKQSREYRSRQSQAPRDKFGTVIRIRSRFELFRKTKQESLDAESSDGYHGRPGDATSSDSWRICIAWCSNRPIAYYTLEPI